MNLLIVEHNSVCRGSSFWYVSFPETGGLAISNATQSWQPDVLESVAELLLDGSQICFGIFSGSDRCFSGAEMVEVFAEPPGKSLPNGFNVYRILLTIKRIGFFSSTMGHAGRENILNFVTLYRMRESSCKGANPVLSRPKPRTRDESCFV